MINQDYNNQVFKAKNRFAERTKQRERTEKLISQNRYFSIDSPDRIDKFLKRRGYSQLDIHNLVKSSVGANPEIASVTNQAPKMLEMIIGDNNLMSVCFLQKGVNTAPATGRIKVIDSASRQVGYATGFMVSPQLLLTNHHVLGDADVLANSMLEFNYQTNLDGTMDQSVLFNFDPNKYYYKNEDLDFVLIAVQSHATGGQPLSKYGWNKMIEEDGKAIIGQYINIIQHPNGDPKEICIRDNQLIDIFDEFLHYKTDTLPGSSGSGLYNDKWEIIGLHHASLPVPGNNQVKSPGTSSSQGQYENEGIRISSIIKDLKAQNWSSGEKAILDGCFNSVPPTPEQRQEQLPVTTGAPYTQTVNNDGSSTWVIPISITVNVGGQSADKTQWQAEPQIPAVIVPATGQGINDAINLAQTELGSITHVIGITSGYQFSNGKITDTPAIVVTMDSDQAAAERMGLPASYKGYAIEVLGPGLEDLLLQTKDARVREMVLTKRGLIEEIVYTSPPGIPLDDVNENIEATFHVSPEQGWKNLKPFLAAANDELVVGMYDFSAKHILNTIVALKDKPGFRMAMAIQKGQSLSAGSGEDDDSTNVKKNDITDEAVVNTLKDTFGNNFDFAWVKIGIVNGWVASSYHIKVAVRDAKAFWLSSGNWQSSNQPDVDTLKLSDDRLIENYNREWHVIVENEKLAKMYKAYIEHDIAENKRLQHMEMATFRLSDLPEFYIRDISPEIKKHYVPFPVEHFNGKLKIKPLLTPDNYFDEAIKLISSASKSLWIENQSFNAINDKGTNPKLKEFLSAILRKQQDGLDVKIIFRVFISSDAKRNVMALKTFGFNTDNIKVLKNCHTKGIIVDKQTVMLGSQNISEQGISINRDASLIVYNATVATYYGKIFEADWDDRATNMFSQSSSVEIAKPGEPVPAGSRRLNLKDMFEGL